MAQPARSLKLPDAEATTALGARLAAALQSAAPASLVVFLEGGLGAGKTTLVRGLLMALGHAGRVPSPTYTLVEPYELAGYRVLHLDLYRLTDPAELTELGLEDDFRGAFLALIEWPDNGFGQLPEADILVRLDAISDGRRVDLVARTLAGESVLSRLV